MITEGFLKENEEVLLGSFRKLSEEDQMAMVTTVSMIIRKISNGLILTLQDKEAEYREAETKTLVLVREIQALSLAGQVISLGMLRLLSKIPTTRTPTTEGKP